MASNFFVRKLEVLLLAGTIYIFLYCSNTFISLGVPHLIGDSDLSLLASRAHLLGELSIAKCTKYTIFMFSIFPSFNFLIF
jgi:hypothetical protein